MKIDAHHHFWRYDVEEYPWISEDMSVLKRDFLPDDLRSEIESAGIDGVVSVHARQSLEEMRWLLRLAEKHDFIRGVVGWAPLTNECLGELLEEFAHSNKLKGFRHVLHDEENDSYVLRDDFNRGIKALTAAGHCYDILIFERHLPQAIRLVDRHPNQVFILDHLAKPRACDHVFSPWRENMRELAKRENVYCKLSGLATEADWKNWTDEELRVYMEITLETFGPRRVMFGSDWPVCLLAITYRRWHELVSLFIESFSPSERDRIMGGTAVEAYKL